MNARQRFWRVMQFDVSGGIPYWADWLGPWKRWKEEGLPVDIRADEDSLRSWALQHFEFEGMYSAFWGQPRVPVDLGVFPPFPLEIFEENQVYRIYRGKDGVIVKQFKDLDNFLQPTQFIEFPVKGRRDWQRFRDERLDPHTRGRYPLDQDWESLKRAWKERDFVLSIDGGSFYGFLRNCMGLEALSVMFYDDEELVSEMMNYLADFFIAILGRAVTEVNVDFAMFWEDMCYKTSSLLSPAMFRRFMVPCYRKVTSFLADHGVQLSWVDCDGNIDSLIPLWLGAGIQGFYPLEVAAGMDAARLRSEYGDRIVMWGNIDKRALARGKQAIDQELARVATTAASGGFIPLVDHQVPDDVPLENYLYYLSRRRALCGNP